MSANDQKLIVLIIAYNEARRIEHVVKSVKNNIPGCYILVINDGSSDGTKHAALKAGANVISHTINLGYGAGLEAGYMYALEHGYDYVLQMDGDGQHLAEEAYKVIEPVVDKETDIAIGSRYLKGTSYKTPFHRRMGQKFFSFIYKMITGLYITDPTSGFQCLNKKALEFNLRVMFPNDFPDINVLLMAYFAKLRVKEISVLMHERSDGASMHSGFRPLNYVLKMFFYILIIILNSKQLRNYGN